MLGALTVKTFSNISIIFRLENYGQSPCNSKVREGQGSPTLPIMDDVILKQKEDYINQVDGFGGTISSFNVNLTDRDWQNWSF